MIYYNIRLQTGILVMDHYNTILLSKRKISTLDPKVAIKIYNLLNINSEQAENGAVRILDSNEELGLYLLHYINYIPAVAHIRGTIVQVTHDEDGNVYANIICQTFPYIEEFTEEDKDFDNILEEIFNPQMRIYEGKEGTFIRVFKERMSGIWFFSTHKRIDGVKSRWSGPRFSETFHQLWGDESVDEYLYDDRVYVFLVSQPENRLVSKIPSPALRLVGEFKNDSNGNCVLLEDTFAMKKVHPCVEILQSKTVDTRAELYDYLVTMNHETHSGAVILSNGKYYRFSPSEYTRLRELRGNEPNLRLRYLTLKYDVADSSFREFTELFKEQQELFDAIETDVVKLRKYLADIYRERYIYRKFIRLPQQEHYVLETAKKYRNEKLSIIQNIHKVLQTSSAKQINGMIKRMNEAMTNNIETFD